MSKHRPGPWGVLAPAEWLSDDGQWVVPGVALCGSGELSEANAHLIAAAPEMLEALKDWLIYAEENLHEFAPEVDPCIGDKLCPKCESAGCLQDKIARTRAAIAKVEGRPLTPAQGQDGS